MRTIFVNDVRGICHLTDMLNRVLRVAFGLLFVLTSLAAHAVTEADLLPPEQAFQLSVTLSAPQQVALDFDTHPGYYLYRDRFSFAVAGTPIHPDQMPPGEGGFQAEVQQWIKERKLRLSRRLQAYVRTPRMANEMHV